MLLIGAIIIMLWGAAHLFPTRSVVKGFGEISLDNRRIITMEWIMEGLALVFMGLLVLLIALFGEEQSLAALIVCRVSAAALLVMAIVSFFTGARTAVLPMKLCPWVKMLAAGMFIWGSVG